MIRITLDLPLPPSVNALHGVRTSKKSKTALFVDEDGRTRVKTGFELRAGVYRQPHYVRWINAAGAEVLAQRPRLSVKRLPRGWYCVRALWPAAAAIDVDNGVKALVDFLHYMQLTPDDANLWAESARRSHLILPGRCRVTAWHIGER